MTFWEAGKDHSVRLLDPLLGLENLSQLAYDLLWLQNANWRSDFYESSSLYCYVPQLVPRSRPTCSRCCPLRLCGGGLLTWVPVVRGAERGA